MQIYAHVIERKVARQEKYWTNIAVKVRLKTDSAPHISDTCSKGRPKRVGDKHKIANV